MSFFKTPCVTSKFDHICAGKVVDGGGGVTHTCLGGYWQNILRKYKTLEPAPKTVWVPDQNIVTFDCSKNDDEILFV